MLIEQRDDSIYKKCASPGTAPVGQANPPPIAVVVNWAANLKR